MDGDKKVFVTKRDVNSFLNHTTFREIIRKAICFNPTEVTNVKHTDPVPQNGQKMTFDLCWSLGKRLLTLQLYTFRVPYSITYEIFIKERPKKKKKPEDCR